MQAEKVTWTDEQIAEVRSMFGEWHRLYGLALVGDPRLVEELKVLVMNNYPLDELIRRMSRTWSIGRHSDQTHDQKLDLARASSLYDELILKQRGRELLKQLRKHYPYRKWLASKK